MKKHDKSACHEIEEMIRDGSIDLSSLSKDVLYNFFDYLCEDENCDRILYRRCLEALNNLEQDTDEIPSAEDVLKTTEKRLEELRANGEKPMIVLEDTSEMPKLRRISRKKLTVILVAAALLTAVLGMTVYAVVNPFSDFGVTIRGLFGMKSGDTVSIDGEELVIGDGVTMFSSVEKLSDAVGIQLMYIKNDEYKCSKACVHSINNEKYASIDYTNPSGFIINFNAYYSYTNELYKETDLSSAQSVTQMRIGEIDAYVFLNGDIHQAVFFYEKVIYVITSSDYDSLIKTLHYIK